tara:strand:+ start:1126 stop:1527 length:402 start_codon:yes stop_codon:yes gene_type:complete
MRITRADMLRKRILDPVWHVLEIVKIFQEPAKKDPDSTNTVVDFKVVRDEDGDTRNADVPLRRYFSEKAQGYAESFMIALGAKVDDDTGAELDFDSEAVVGKQLLGLVKNRPLDGGGLTNDVEEFQPVDEPSA